MAKANQIRAFLGMDLTQFQKGLKKAESRLYKTMRTLDRVGQGLTRTITLPVIAFGAASIKAAADIDKLKKGLEGIMGSADLAAKEFNNLRKIARNPGLDLKSAVQGSIKLQAIGMSADEARHKLGILANAVALVGGSGEDLGGVSLAITQIIGKGKVQAEEINQIAERLPQVRKAMQDAFGTADTEVLQKMGMSAENFVDDIVNELGKLPKAKASIQDTLNNLKDDFNVLAASIGAKLMPILNKLMGVVLNIIGVWGRLSDAQQNSIIKWGLIAAAIGPAILALKGVVAVFHTLTKVMMAKSLFSPWTMAIAAIAAGAVLIYKYWDEVKRKIVEISNKFIDWYNDSVLLRVVVQTIVVAFKSIWATIKAIGSGASTFIKALWEAIKNPFDNGEIISGMMSDFKDIGKQLNEDIDSAFEKGAANINLLEKVEHISESDVDKIFEPLSNGINKIKNGIANAISGGGAGGGGEVQTKEQVKTGGLIKNALNPLESMTAKVDIKINEQSLQESVDFTKSAFYKMAEVIADNFEKVVDIAKTLFSSLSGVSDAYFEKKYAQVEKDYQAQKEFAENIVGTERQKAAMMEEIEESRAKKVKAIRRKEAIANKTKSIFDSLLNGAVAVTQALAGPGGPIMAAVVGGMAAAQTALIASTPIPALASGGLATAPTLAMVGDNRNAKVDPEVIAPLSKLKGMLNTGQNITVGGAIDIHGDALRMVLERADYDHTRRTGYGRAV